MSINRAGEMRIMVTLSKLNLPGEWLLTRHAEPSPAQKTEDGLKIFAENLLPEGADPESWPEVTVRFFPRAEAERILEPYEGSYDFLDNPPPIPGGSFLTFQVKQVIDPTHQENRWRLGIWVDTNVKAQAPLDSPEIQIEC